MTGFYGTGESFETVGGPEPWPIIGTAPRDGSHILVTNNGASTTVVHWFDGGWHLSVNLMGDYSEYVWGPPTHWMPIPPFHGGPHV